MTRREWLKKMGIWGSMALPPWGWANHFDPQKERSLSLYNIHTGEMATTVFWADGHYVPESLDALNLLLRDHRSGDVCMMDVELMELLYSLSDIFGHKKSFHVVSGYRSLQTNETLRQTSTGVAQNSFHTKGQAMDIYLPGIELSTLREAAIALNEGGVGYYPSSGFVHVDTGHVRSWPKSTPPLKIPETAPPFSTQPLPPLGGNFLGSLIG